MRLYLTIHRYAEIFNSSSNSWDYIPQFTCELWSLRVHTNHETVPHSSQVCYDIPQLMEVMTLYLMIHDYMVVFHNL
jgi:hypothetical protein